MIFLAWCIYYILLSSQDHYSIFSLKHNKVIVRYGKVIVRYGKVIVRYGKVIVRYGKVIVRYGKVIVRGLNPSIYAGFQAPKSFKSFKTLKTITSGERVWKGDSSIIVII
ncbi:MAG: hypothetical protein HQK94_18150 [Nitrospirae bacterium]|nr:hypothetical protein [Nitrospirota bacterium]